MIDFDSAVAKLFALEGGYAERDSTAGSVNFGITERFLDRINYPVKPIDLTKEEAKGLYRVYFWGRLKLDNIRHEALAQLVFICAVNVGRVRATKLLQRVAGVRADGIVGPITLNAVNQCSEGLLLDLFRLQMEAFYRQLAKQRKYKKYLKAWLARLK